MEQRNQIKELAYKIYENTGKAEGRDLDNWLEAERLIMIKTSHDEARDKETVDEIELQEV
jgi:hypothetical protein